MLLSERLFQQFLINMYVKVASERISYLHHNQDQLRHDNYTSLRAANGDIAGIQDEAEQVRRGTLVVFPSTFVGGDQWMRQKMHDIIATSNTLGFPDIFLTMTCNPHWTEITESLEPGQSGKDRIDPCNRSFQ